MTTQDKIAEVIEAMNDADLRKAVVLLISEIGSCGMTSDNFRSLKLFEPSPLDRARKALMGAGFVPAGDVFVSHPIGNELRLHFGNQAQVWRLPETAK